MCVSVCVSVCVCAGVTVSFMSLINLRSPEDELRLQSAVRHPPSGLILPLWSRSGTSLLDRLAPDRKHSQAFTAVYQFFYARVKNLEAVVSSAVLHKKLLFFLHFYINSLNDLMFQLSDSGQSSLIDLKEFRIVIPHLV